MGEVWDWIKDASKVALPFVGAGLDFFGGLLQNSANADEAARNRRFVAAMYKKRYQNTMEDMRKAGLNPVLAMNSGMVGSSPGAGGIPHMENALGGATGTALSVAQGMAGIRKSEQDVNKSEAETDLARSRKIEQDIYNTELPKTVRAQAFKAEAEASLANSASVIQRARAQYADELAANEETKSYNDAVGSKYRNLNDFWDYQHNKKDYYARPSTSEERNWWRAKKILDSVGAGVNSAVGLGKLRRYLR